MSAIDPTVPTEVIAEELRKRREAGQQKIDEGKREVKATDIVHRKGAGRPLAYPRCACGKHSAATAKVRGLGCQLTKDKKERGK